MEVCREIEQGDRILRVTVAEAPEKGDVGSERQQLALEFVALLVTGAAYCFTA